MDTSSASSSESWGRMDVNGLLVSGVIAGELDAELKGVAFLDRPSNLSATTLEEAYGLDRLLALVIMNQLRVEGVYARDCLTSKGLAQIVSNAYLAMTVADSGVALAARSRYMGYTKWFAYPVGSQDVNSWNFRVLIRLTQVLLAKLTLTDEHRQCVITMLETPHDERPVGSTTFAHVSAQLVGAGR